MKEKQYTTVEVEKETHKLLRQESDKTGVKIRVLVEKAIRQMIKKR
ncbi:MAG: ribbon-helix-helix domain-containing protein [Promethearchaeota archaeon]